MSDVNATAGAAAQDNATVLRMIQASKDAAAAGRNGEADQLLARAAQLAPTHPAVLNELGLRMMQRGEAAQARELFQRATQGDPKHPALWSNLASSLHALNLLPEELEAIERALSLEPRHLPSLLQKGLLFEQIGDPRNAARTYRNALATLPPGQPPPETVAAVIEHARAVISQDDAALAEAIGQRLSRDTRAPRRRRLSGASSIASICSPAGARVIRRSRPSCTFLRFPRSSSSIAVISPGWMRLKRRATTSVRSSRACSSPIARASSPTWRIATECPLTSGRSSTSRVAGARTSSGTSRCRKPEHLARCPRTAERPARARRSAMWRARGPTAYFSILEARTRIPPHTGVTNTRLTVHLPLIVPPGCGFRVGSETREWVPGKAWVFDDTIEHEAWNESDTPRAILIFDIWNPFLTPAERDLIRAATEVVGTYYGTTTQEPL